MADAPRSGPPVLEIRGLSVYYGAAQALQGVDLTLPSGTLSVVGRNGMGKTTLCKTIVGLQRAAAGSIRFMGQELTRLDPASIARLGIGYVPQGRRLWPSLTVDEHLRLTQAGRRGAWSVERVYDTFPRLAERKGNRGNQLSGGEQQMLAISRALLLDPKLLVMDEPTEGLAPVIVAHVEELLVRLAEEGNLSVLIIEQNIGVATAVADSVAIMVNGRVNRTMPSAALAADRDLQQRLLGVGRPGSAPDAALVADPSPSAGISPQSAAARAKGPVRVWISNPVLPTRWSQPTPVARIDAAARTVTPVEIRPVAAPSGLDLHPLSAGGEPVVLVVGTLDTKGEELRFLADILRGHGHRTRIVDLSTAGRPSSADVPPHQVAAFHRRGAAGVFTGDKATAVPAMADAFEAWIRRQSGIAGVLAAGGACGTRMVAPALRTLPVGVPKVVVSTVASGDVASIVGPADIMVLPSVTDVAGLNAVSRQVLANAAEAVAGMVAARAAALKSARHGRAGRPDLPAVGLTVAPGTAATVDAVTTLLRGEFDCLAFPAPVGARSMEKLADGGALAGVIDVALGDLAAHLLAGTPGAEDRFGALIRTRIPAVLAPGGLDALAFGPPETVPAHLSGRRTASHGASVTLVRISPAEAADLGRHLADRLNRCDGPVRLLIPAAGLSPEGRAGGPLADPEADAALFAALEATLRQTGARKLQRLPLAIDDPAFAAALAEAFRGLAGGRRPTRRTVPS
jgi:uncharacterized protein (UPF0261 family)/ABC-type branched-subunit amino acid transport system ATPase component